MTNLETTCRLRGYTIIRHWSGYGTFTVYNQLGHVVAVGFGTEQAAKDHIDSLLTANKPQCNKP